MVGPFALLYAGGYARVPKSRFARRGSGYRPTKILAVVDQGAVVTVAISPSAARVTALLYDPERFNRSGYDVSDGERAVTFEACPRGQASIGPPAAATQFPGGFIVAGPRCVPLDVWIGSDSQPTRVVVSFGARPCSR